MTCDGLPVIMIRGVLHSRRSGDLSCFVFPPLPETSSKHRRRLAVRAAFQRFAASLAGLHLRAG